MVERPVGLAEMAVVSYHSKATYLCLMVTLLRVSHVTAFICIRFYKCAAKFEEFDRPRVLDSMNINCKQTKEQLLYTKT